MTAPQPLICNVCHRPLAECDQYLVRYDSVRATTTVVHRSLCFPPARTAEAKPEHRAVA